MRYKKNDLLFYFKTDMLGDIYDAYAGEGTDQNQHVHPTSFHVRPNVWRTSDPYFDAHSAVGGESRSDD